MAFQIEEATIDGIHEAMRSGATSSAALVDEYRARIDAIDRDGPQLNSVLGMNERAAERAAELDAELTRTGELAGPLHGIPVLVKDCVETSEIPTTFGSAAITDYTPAQDAVTVRKLREAGAVILGKTTLPDFATSWFSYSSVSGETKNPYDLDRDPGGSSAGTGCGDRRQSRRRRHRDRLRRVDPPSLVVLRAGRRPQHAGRGAAHRVLVPGDLPGHDRADDALGG